MTALAEIGIHLRRQEPGQHRARCPECARTKSRPNDTALAVRVEAGGPATWFCHRCLWKGGLAPVGGPIGGPSGTPQRHHRPPPKPAAPMRGGTVSRIGRTAPLAEAARLWRECQVIVPGSVAATYLEGRACALPHPDGDLRWHPALAYPLSGRTFPALVAKVTDAITGEGLTVHRTWMAADGSGKAPVEKPRLLWPGLPKAGGVVRLWPDEEVSTGLLIGEGLETCLSAALGFTPVWVALDAGNLGSLPVLEGIEMLTVIADHDEVGIAAAEECARRWDAAGAEVRLWLPPDAGTDLNDFARRTRHDTLG